MFKQITTYLFYISLFLYITSVSYAQTSYVITGKVTDSETGEGMPFVAVAFKGTTIGTTTDFNGNYKLVTHTLQDSLTATAISYTEKSKLVNRKATTQAIDFQLVPASISLNEIKIYAGENPAYAILRKIVRNKEKNDKRSLDYFEYESYNKIEIDVDNISEKLKKRKAIKKIQQVIDSVEVLAGEDGKPILPLFISESFSNVYYRKSPEKKREHILKTRVTGVGIQDGTLISQMAGSSFQEYNFYRNWLNILNKDFVSPIADGWKLYYEYFLVDSAEVNGHYSYRIDFEPKRPQDLAFTGTMWIDKATFALVQVDATMSKTANLNFIEKIKLQQELAPTEAGPWIPVKTRVLIDVAEITNQSAGMLAKFYTSNERVVVNQPHSTKFYDVGIEMEPTAQIKDEAFWDEHRHEPLTESEKNVYAMIDSIKNIPLIRSYIEIANIVVNGYKKAGPIDIGPYILAYSYNTVEGSYARLGFKTNIDFSDKWVLKGYGGYGFGDHRFKYGAEIQRIFSKKHWTTLSVRHSYDLERVGLLSQDVWDNTLFLVSSRFGTFRRPFMLRNNQIAFQTDFVRGFTQKIKLRQWQFDPLYNFTYYTNPTDTQLATDDNFQSTEITFESRFAQNEQFLINDNTRISLGTTKPVLTLSYTLGLKGIVGGGFNYHKIALNLSQSINVGSLGRASYSISAGYIPSTVPYPILQSHQGNQTFFYINNAYNLMNFFEFVSDRYASVQLQHNFEGLLFNRIPLIRKLKWRLVANANVLYGGLSDKNYNLVPLEYDDKGNASRPIGRLGDVPYIELGYGIENIFRFMRIDAIHRLTYLNNSGTNRFGVKISFQFKL
ncbi:DUF5686 and carboxypeptidase-like regulatory domain-containing protein [Xanthocytophaga flava]|uniref:DUF5686 and carboxypeptidase-like regulatory domain-containing protein n=1 Tax=Xanthocytophaga flava TaxID=3048013 RepID=UPI0028D23787|nr:DUF5686 family protein [Xanthocytophaga flavus]MDJ1467874.1 DUF5686 family protein [Xanthocytophaga flavus]